MANNNVMMWIIIAIIAVVLVNGGFLSDLGGLFGGTDSGTDDSDTVECNSDSGTTVTFGPAQDKYTSLAVGGQHAYKVNDGPIKRVSDGSTATLSAGDTLEVLWGNASTTSSYFSTIDSYSIPCRPTLTVVPEEAMVQNGTLTIEVFNEEGNLINGGLENETVVAGDVVTLEAKLKGQFQKGFPHGGIIIAEYNTSEIDTVNVNFGGVETNVPGLYTVSSVSNVAKAYTVPAILSNQILTGSVVIDADDTVNPTSANDPVLTFRPNNPYIDEDQGGLFAGVAVEDEDDVATQVFSKTFTVHLD